MALADFRRSFWTALRLKKMARPKRFELLTPRFVVWCSIQLSYGRVANRFDQAGRRQGREPMEAPGQRQAAGAGAVTRAKSVPKSAKSPWHCAKSRRCGPSALVAGGWGR